MCQQNFAHYRAVALLFLGVLLLGTTFSRASATAYEAPLPAELTTSDELCSYLPCGEVIKADSFSPRKGSARHAEAYRTEHGEQQLAGYVFLSTDIVDIPAYSGKPVVTLIGMDSKGIITGVKILKHSEPILLVGIPEEELIKFVGQYVGTFAGAKVEIGHARADEGYKGVDAISGATVTVIAQNQVVMSCAYAVAKEVGIIKAEERPQASFTAADNHPDWKQLLAEGSVQRITVDATDVGQSRSDTPYIDLYFGYLNAPAIGRAILGDDNYRRLMLDLQPNEHAIFIIANGLASFKGSGFVRGGIYDRIQVAQEMDSFTFRDTDYRNLYNLDAAGAPSYRESGIFILRSKNFSAAYPWHLVFLANTQDKKTGQRSFSNFDKEYWLPGDYLVGGRPAYHAPEPPWMRMWKLRAVEIGLFVLLLVAAAIAYGKRDWLVRRSSHKDKRWLTTPKYLIMVLSMGFVGYYAMAQPSITHVMTWIHSMLYHWKWELFLSDPFVFIFWWFIIITLVLWGRGLFCGWLCPYGALSELAYRVAGKLGLKRFQFLPPKWLHHKLKWLKYLIFFGLLVTSFFSMGLAEKLAEVEPFKTTFLVGVTHRSWPFVLFWSVLLALALFIERPFCKYLCPLGAALALPTQFRLFGLKRKKECTRCTACAVGCGSLAIDEQGRIDQKECLLCLDCMVLYYDDHACPPLAKERKRRSKAGEPLSAIGSDGYYVPLSSIKRPSAGE